MTSYAVPTPASSPIGVIVVPSGDVWICEFLGQKIAKFSPSTKKFTEYPVPLTLLGPAVVRAFTSNRYIWFTALAANAIGRVDITTGAMKAYPNTANLGVPIEDTADGIGNVWFSTALSNTLNYLTPSTGQITEIPQPDGGVTATPVSLPPAADIAMHWVAQDNSMWFTELAANRVGRYQLTSTQ